MPKFRDIRKYLGDDILENLVRECDNSYKTFKSEIRDYKRKRDKAIVAAFFLTGGLVGEVLLLRKRNFDFEDREAKRKKGFLVKDMIVLRRKERIGRRKLVTRDFIVLYDEPLVKYLVDWVKLLPSSNDKLIPMKRVNIWLIIRKLGERVLDFPITANDIRNQRMFYLVEKRGFTPVEVREYLRMEGTPAILRHLPATGKHERGEKDETLDFDLFDQEILSKAKKMANFYVAYFSLENSVRKLITDILTEKHSTKWWDENVPPKIRENVRKLQEEERDTAMSIRSEDNLAYTNFGELIEIISFNWNDFAEILRSRKSLQYISQFNKIRNIIAHSCELSANEILRLKLLINDWFKIQERK
jgi:hypothetical protein